MRELRLKYIIQMVSDIGAKAKSDAQALTQAQRMVDDALKKTQGEVGAIERVLLRLGGVAGKSAQDQAVYLGKLAMRYQDVRKAAEGAANAMTTAAKVGAGAAAAGYAADRMTRAPMEYSLRLAHMANTAYADRDMPGRIAGKQTLNAAITAAIRTGGGKRDDAAGTLDALIASGAVSIDDSIKLLPMLMKASTASGATAEQLGSIALRGMQSFGIKRDQVPDVLNMAMAAGQAGGFELRDMAKWLPQAMALGKNSGLGGVEGLRRIIASMQASVITAGTKDEAGNNVVNLLGKVNSVDTAKDFKKATGIDLTAHLDDGRQYRVATDVTVASGTVLASLIAVVAGEAGNLADSAALKLVSPIVGIDTAFTAASGVGGGADVEADDDASYRLQQRLASEPMGGSPADYARWALAVPGITRAWGVRNPAGPTSAGVIIMADGNAGDGLPTTGQRDQVLDYIRDPLRGPPDELFVIIPTPVPVPWVIHLSPDTAAIRTAVDAGLKDLFFREANPGGSIPHSHATEVISSVVGEYNHTISTPTIVSGGFFTVDAYNKLLMYGGVTFD